MKSESIPVLSGNAVVLGHKTTFNTLDKEVIVEAPARVIKSILSLCDGHRNLKQVIDKLSEEWDVKDVSDLIDRLNSENILLDGRNLEDVTWKIVTNPQQFPRSIGTDEVAKLVSDATKRHRKDYFQPTFSPSKGFLSDIIRNRKSTRSFSGEVIDFQSLIDILWSAYGECVSDFGQKHRVIPSAGALYPLMIHVGLFTKIDQLDPGVYAVVYGSDNSVGFDLVSSDLLQFARAFLNPAGILSGINGVIVISGSFSIPNKKYGNRTLLYTPIEAGHSAQNILLEATKQGIATLEIGGFIDDLLRESINLPDGYHPMISVAFGKEGNQKSLEKENLPEIDWAVPVADKYRPGFAIASTRLSKDSDWSHGRDPSPELAMKKAISETKEWTACGSVPELTHATFLELENAIDPREVIKFHQKQYQVGRFPFGKFDDQKSYGWTTGFDLDGNEFYILADHVYFPYFPDTPYYCYANSSGCAAHPNYDVAIQTGVLELVERDAFMNAYLCKLDMPVVSIDSLPGSIQKRIQDLKDAGFDVWIIDHSIDLAPVVFVYVQNKDINFTTCASCSSFDIEHAVSHALMEVEASVLHRLQNGQPDPIKYISVVWPNDHGRLYGQKQYFCKSDFLVDSGRSITFGDIGKSVAKNWNELLGRFEDNGWKTLVVPLNLSDDYGGNGDLSIVRTLVPGTVQMTFGYRQEPAGMRRLYEISERFGNGQIGYSQLTKFPHPFE